MTWPVERVSSSAAAFHARDLPDSVARAVWVCDATGPALVLGSAQADEGVDRAACAAAGVDVVRRRSGGGAVLVVPGQVLWVDLVLPAGDPLWQDDVGRAFHWVGDVWAAALQDVGLTAGVHRRGLVSTPWSRQVCFAGLGPGEVTVDGRKAVGISQRRTRTAARFQCAALARWDPTAIVHLLGLPPSATGELVDAAVGVGVDLDVLCDAFVHRLP